MSAVGSTDVFVSYSSEDRDIAAGLVELLRKDGRSVWWDRTNLQGGQTYHSKILAALNSATVVVVLFSDSAAVSDWVYDEANRAREADKVVPARLDEAEVPMPFGALHIIDLRGFGGDPNHPGVAPLLDAIDMHTIKSPTKRAVRRVRRIQTGPGRKAALRRLIPPLLAAIMLTLIHFWVLLHLELGATLLPLFEAIAVVLLTLVKLRDGLELALLRLVALVCDRRSLAVQLILVMILLCVSSVRVELPPAAVPLDISVRVGDESISSGTLSVSNRVFHSLIPILPWGREVSVSVEGHRPVEARLLSWSGVDLAADRQQGMATLLLRLPEFWRWLQSPDTRLELSMNGSRLGEALILDHSRAAITLGPLKEPDEALQDRWRAELETRGIADAQGIEEIVQLWSTPFKLVVDRSIPLDASLTARLTAPGKIFETPPFSAGGRPFADILLDLKEIN